MYDAWRCLQSTKRDYAFYSHVHKPQSRIDYFIMDKLLLQNVTKAQIHNISWSDHVPITTEMNTGQLGTNYKLWRNNTHSFPRETFVCDKKKKNLRELFVLNNGLMKSTTLWFAHKAFVRCLLIQLAAREKKRKSFELN